MGTSTLGTLRRGRCKAVGVCTLQWSPPPLLGVDPGERRNAPEYSEHHPSSKKMGRTPTDIRPGKNKLWRSRKMEHTIKNKNELQPHVSPWMNLRKMMLLSTKSHKISHRIIHLYKVPKCFICIHMYLFLN